MTVVRAGMLMPAASVSVAKTTLIRPRWKRLSTSAFHPAECRRHMMRNGHARMQTCKTNKISCVEGWMQSSCVGGGCTGEQASVVASCAVEQRILHLCRDGLGL
jgi:hypothetical protein